MTEPSGGSDLAALKTTAVRDGDDWVLNGSKTFITNGYQADLVIVAARTDPSKGAKGITLFMVEAGMEGFARGRKLDKVGQDESDTAELFFEDVRVPDDEPARRGGHGLHLDDAAPAAGAHRRRRRQPRARRARSSRRPSSTPRSARRSGRRSASFQHNKFLMAELVTKLEVTQAYVDDCVAAHAEGKLHRRSTPPRRSGGPRRCRTTCSTTASSCTAATAS